VPATLEGGTRVKDFEGKVAVVTGAASGIGRALAEHFATAGMQVVLADVEETALARTADAMKSRGATVLPVVTDVCKPESVDALAQKTLDRFGAVHVLCNNAGVAVGGLTWEMSLADWQWVVGVNLWGVIHGVRTFVPLMLKQGGPGHVVNTASIAGLISGPMMSVYNVTKHAVVTLSETLQHDLSMVGSAIKVSVLCPAWVNTRINESDRNRPASLPGRPEPPQAAAMREQMGQLLASGLDPAQVARLVFDAVRDERFYVLPHQDFKAFVRRRMEDILEERTPTLAPVA
jgi:NAD(P)-dependent dehydrogenase (short-subunit alcohol dehydrogenase family)